MRLHTSRRALCVGLALGLSALVACDDDDDVTNTLIVTPVLQTNLVADVAAFGAITVDPLLMNPWGIAFGPTGVLWVANNTTGTSTTYSGAGVKLSTVVRIPTSTAATGGAPTGVVFNGTTDFTIPGFGTSLFIFAGEDGTISAWNLATGDAKLVANRSASGAVYKGLAIASNGGVNALYATDFRNNAIDVYDVNFNFVRSFTDPTMPGGFAPFGIQSIAGTLYVSFAKQRLPDKVDDDAALGNGFVDVFNTDGMFFKRLISGGQLNSPWAMAIAPAGFANVGGALLVGNFGDGHIGAYDPATGAFFGLLRNDSNNPVTIEGLWGLAFGPGSASSTLYFASGPDDETHGLVGTLVTQP